MARLTAALAAMALAGWGAEFGFTLGSPVAAQDFRFKSAAFVFRTEGCPGPEKPELSSTAVGVVGGERHSVPATVVPTNKPGVYAVVQSWPEAGKWVVSLKGTCGSHSAGAVIPMGRKGFIRELAKFFPHPATDGEIEASLKALTQGDKQ